MKPTISIALLALGLTSPAPAMAIDYLQCEAMARVMTGATHSVWQTERAWRNRVTANACPPERFKRPDPNPSRIALATPELGTLMLTDHKALEQCRMDYLSANYSVRGELIGVKTFSPGGAQIAARHDRALSDYKAAGCP